MTNFLAKKEAPVMSLFLFLCWYKKGIFRQRRKGVPINEGCFIETGSSLWHWQGPLGSVAEIDCDLTKRLPGSRLYTCQGLARWAACRVSLSCTNTEESHLWTKKCSHSRPASLLVHFFSFINQSCRLRPDPPSPGLHSPHHSFPLVSDRCPSLLAVLIQQSNVDVQ